MKRTLGELADMLDVLKEAKENVLAAERDLRFGGNQATVEGKREILAREQRLLQAVRDEVVFSDEDDEL